MITTNDNKQVIKALVEIQSDIHSVHKNKKNTFHGYTYADMESYLQEIRPKLAEKGLALLFSVDEEHLISAGHVTVSGTLTAIHSSGESIAIRSRGEGTDLSKDGKAGDKATYKAITGFRKYALSCLFNIATTDDPEKADPKQRKAKDKPEPSKSGRPVANMSESQTMQYEEETYVEEVTQKKRTDEKGNPYTQYFVKTANRLYSTFKLPIAEKAKKFKEAGGPVIIGYMKAQKYDAWEIMDIEVWSPDV